MKQLSLAVVLLLSSSTSFQSNEIAGVQGLRLLSGEHGIFDKAAQKFAQSDLDKQDAALRHQENLIQAQAIAAQESSEPQALNQLASEEGSDKLIQRIKQKVDAVKKPKKSPKKVEAVMADLDEPRDDFEGFGSITAMVQNKDKLVEKTMEDPSFKAQIDADLQKKKAVEEKERLKEEAKDKVAMDIKKKAMKAKLSAAREKLEDALNQSTKKHNSGGPHFRSSSEADPLYEDKLLPPVIKTQEDLDEQAAAQEPAPTPPPAPVLAIKPLVIKPLSSLASLSAPKVPAATSAYQKAIQSVLGKKKITFKAPALAAAVIKTPEVPSKIEEQGFIGKFSEKMNAQDQVNKEIMAQEIIKKEAGSYSLDAPGHKGMLARAMEKDNAEAQQKVQSQQDALMDEAMSDPSFKEQMEQLKSQKA